MSLDKLSSLNKLTIIYPKEVGLYKSIIYPKEVGLYKRISNNVYVNINWDIKPELSMAEICPKV